MYAIEKINNEIKIKTDLQKRISMIEQQLYSGAAA